MARDVDVKIVLRALDETGPGVRSAQKRLERLQRDAARLRRSQERNQGRSGAGGAGQQDAARRQQEAADRQAQRAQREQQRADQARERQERSDNRGGRNGPGGGGRGGAAGAGLGGAMGAAAGRMLPAAGAGFLATSIVTAAADFETALTNIQKKAGASAAETAALGEEIKALATGGELAVPIEEIAAAYERGAAAGIPLDELREFAALSAKAADAFEMTATDVGNAAAGFNKVLDVPMAEMERLFDLVNGLADSGIADESDIVRFMDQAGAMSKTFGLTVQQTAAMGAALANLKVPAAKAATAMNAILTKILAPNALSGDAKQALGELVGDFGEFAELVEEDADGALVGLLKRLKSLDKVTRTGIIAELFGQDHLDVVSQMVEGSEEIERNLRYAAGQDWFGSLDKSYQLKLDDFWSQFQLLKNSLSELAIDLGTMGMPAFEEGLQSARALVEEIGAGLETFEARVNWDDVSDANAAVGELITAMGDLMGVDTSGGQHIQKFFRDMSTIINDVATGVKETKEFVEWMDERVQSAKGAIGIEGVPEESKLPWTDQRIGPDPLQMTIPEGGALDIWRDAFGRTIDRITGHPVRGSDVDARAREWLAERPNLLSPESIGEVPATLSPPSFAMSRFKPDQASGLERATSGGGAASGPIDVTVTNLPDIGAVPLPSWRSDAVGPIVSGPPGFQAGRGVTFGGPRFDERFDTGGTAVEGADELRAAMVDAGAQGASDLEAGGRSAANAIMQAAAALQQAAEAIRTNGQAAAAAISGARVNVTLPGGGQLATGNRGRTMPDAGIPGGGSLSGRNTGRTMPYAGSPASGAEGARS